MAVFTGFLGIQRGRDACATIDAAIHFSKTDLDSGPYE